MKTQKTFLTLFLIAITSLNIYAQFGPPYTMPNYGANQPVHNQAIRWDRNPNQGHFNFDSWTSENSPSQKYLYTVEMANDSVFQATLFVDFYKSNYFFNIKSKEVLKSITPKQTKSISRITKEGFKLVGVPNDTCWLFLVSFGKINSYSPLSEMDPAFTTAIQKGNGPILPLTQANLIQMIGAPSPKVERLIKSKKLIEALQKYNTEK